VLTKLQLSPSSASYSVTDGKGSIRTILDGGASRYRRDLIGVNSSVKVSWLCDRDQYRYFRAFYRSLLQNGSKAFILDLILDNPTPVPHTCRFIPGSVSLSEQSGLMYVVSAELEVEPSDIDEDAEAAFAFLFSMFGSTWETDFPHIESDLDNIINVELPADI